MRKRLTVRMVGSGRPTVDQNLINEKLCSTQACNGTLGPVLESGTVTHG